MRLILSTDQAELFRKAVSALHAQKIEIRTEEIVNKDWSDHAYGIVQYLLWVYNEDQVDQARHIVEKCLENKDEPPPSPESPLVPPIPHMEKPLPQKFIQSTFKENEKKAEPLEKIRPHIQITNFLILLCSLILLLELYSAKSQEEIPPQVQQMILTNSSVQKQLFFDYPEHFELIDKIIALYGYKALVKPNELPAPGKFLYEESLKTPWWQGIYPQLTKRQEDKKNVRHAPLFEKIRQGEIWRLVSPILLHNDILHLFFNMIWLLLLGTQIESHISPFRYIFFILIVGILSNICQYLVSGPAFLGFSGVDVGMAFFIRARQKKAPWEGYLMSTGTFRFILFFITILTCISIGAFLLEVFGSYSFPMMIANTAHITGALIGWWLGSSRFFSWQHRYD